MGARSIASSPLNKLQKNNLELSAPASVESLKSLPEDFDMSRKKIALVITLILGSSVIAGISYAQEAVDPQVILAAQEPGTTPPDQRLFSLFVDGGVFLGIYAEDISKENMSRYGVREVRGVGVTQVVKDSPAEKAGLKKDDVILRFDGESVTSVRKLSRLVSEASADQTVRLTISRGGSEQEVSATLAKRSGLESIIAPSVRDEVLRGFPRGGFEINSSEGPFVFSFGGNRRIGVSTETLSKQLADYFGAKDGGLLITSVSDNSPAAKAGLKAGDVITAIDGEKVTSSGDVSRAINKKQDGDVTLTIIRDRSTRTIRLTPEKNPQAPIARPGTMATRRVVIPSIQVPAIPEMNIQIPRIVIPATPQIDVTVPQRAPPVARPRVIII
jgi:membrane-associated protease RseP (regulator of RpoE activity)